MTADTFDRFDSAGYLASPKDAAAYLCAAFDEAGDNSAVITQALGVIARSGIMADLARRAGMSREGLDKALAETGDPSFATVAKVTSALGLRLHLEPALSS